jgi:3-keto-5-aminohexanoate cleavage enzyme
MIIEAAVNGATPRSRNPNVPREPEEVAADALACLDAGAAVVHNHTDDPNVGGATHHDPAPYASAWAPVLAVRPDALLYPTMAGGDGGRTPIPERYAHLAALHDDGLLPMALADPGSFSIAGIRPDGSVAGTPWVYENTSADAAWMFAWCTERHLPVSVTIFEPGFLRLALAHQEAGTLPPGAMLGLVFGGPRVPVGLPPTERSLDAYVSMLEGTGLPWTVRVVGDDVVRCGLAGHAAERGGHVRVGLEDWDGDGTPTNAELVTAAVGVAEQVGRPVATSAEARRLLSA